MWCEQATTPGWMPSVTHAFTTKWPDPGLHPDQISRLHAHPRRVPGMEPQRGWCARSRSATSRSRCACESARAAGRSRSGTSGPRPASTCARGSAHSPARPVPAIPTRPASGTRTRAVPTASESPAAPRRPPSIPTRRRPSPFAVQRRQRHHVQRWRRRPPRKGPPAQVHMHILQLTLRDTLFVDRPDRRVDLEGPVAAHVLERRQPLTRGLLGQPRHRVLEDPSVVLCPTVIFSPGRARDSKNSRIPREPSGSMRHVSSIQNSFSLPHLARGHVAGGGDLFAQSLACRGRSTGCRKPTQSPSYCSYEVRSWRSDEWPIGRT